MRLGQPVAPPIDVGVFVLVAEHRGVNGSGGGIMRRPYLCSRSACRNLPILHHYHLGLTLIATGQKAKGREQLESALRLKLNNADAQEAQQFACGSQTEEYGFARGKICGLPLEDGTQPKLSFDTNKMVDSKSPEQNVLLQGARSGCCLKTVDETTGKTSLSRRCCRRLLFLGASMTCAQEEDPIELSRSRNSIHREV